MEELLTIRETAELCKVSDRTVKRWMSRGLRSFRIGNVVRIRPGDLSDYVNKHSYSEKLRVKRGIDRILDVG